ncbi:MAG: hypothetical protein OXH76_24250, partial [Boseongicola sp.]|nr:hypothetical protein [Boseongicola sp.]
TDEPDGDVTLTVGTGTGYTVGDPASAAVRVKDNDGPPTGIALSVNPGAHAEGGGPVEVTVTATMEGASVFSAATAVTVSVRGSGNVGTVDFAPVAAFVIVIPAEASSGWGQFTLAPEDDTVAEADETVSVSGAAGGVRVFPATLILTDDDGVAVRVGDPWLSRFGRAVAGQAMATLAERFAVPPDMSAHMMLGGRRIGLTAASDRGRAPGTSEGPRLRKDAGPSLTPAVPGGAESRTMTGREFLLESSFQLALDGGGESGARPDGRWTIWGRASLENFSGRDGGLSVDGEVVTGTFGADRESGRWLSGVALTHGVGEGEVRAGGMDLAWDVESTVTTVNPYLRLALSDRVTAWGLAGYGRGDLVLTMKGGRDGSAERYGTGLAMTLGAFGSRAVLLRPAENDGFALAFRSDAFFVRTTSDAVRVPGLGIHVAAQADASRMRLALEGSRTVTLGNGATLTSGLEAGLRRDGGDAETGTGLEAGGKIVYADPSSGLSMDLRARILAAHAESDYREYGVSGSLRIAPDAHGRGPSLSLAAAFGSGAGGTGRLWTARDAVDFAPANGGAEPSGRLDVEAGYGFPTFGGTFTGTPYAGFGHDGTERRYRLGWRLTRPAEAGSFRSFLEARRRETGDDGIPEHAIGFRLIALW